MAVVDGVAIPEPRVEEGSKVVLVMIVGHRFDDLIEVEITEVRRLGSCTGTDSVLGPREENAVRRRTRITVLLPESSIDGGGATRLRPP